VFVGRVAEGRHKQPSDIEPIAQGRVWTGARAKELGLVDEIGGLDAAIAEARKLAGPGAGSELEIYPPAPTLRDLLAGFGQVQAPFGLDAGGAGSLRAVLAGLAASAAIDRTVTAATERLIQLVVSFRSSTIQAVAMLPVMQ
jgi:protease-4